MTKWQEVRLGDVCKFQNGKKRPKEPGKYPVFGGNGILDYTNQFNSNVGVIVGRVGAYCGSVFLSKEKCWVSDNAILGINTSDTDIIYLYYLLKSLNLNAKHIGSGQPLITQDILNNIKIFLPPIDVQKKIAGVLGALDDKIELNNRINNNLEQQAQALFNEKILNNPKQGCIGDYCSIKSGFAFKSSWWQDVGVRVIKIKNIESSELNLHECSYVSEDKISIAKDFVVKGGDLLIAMTGATIGKFAIVPHVDEILLVNQRVGKFFLGDNPLEKLPFIYCTLKQPEVVSEIINRGQGSAQPNISGNDIMSITCTYPDENIIANFNNICRPYFEKIIMNQYENTRLSALRDTLLPKLMSGEIDVSNVDISALTSTDKLSFTGV